MVIAELTSKPWVINAPDGLTGRVRIEARAKDNLETESTVTGIDVVIGDTLIAFGNECTENAACESNLCALDSSGVGTCSQSCELEAESNSCPADSSCIDAGGQGVCWQSKSESGLCSASGSSSLLSGLMMLLAFGFWRRRRRVRA